MSRSVLTITDLTERSDAAVVWADSIARARGWDLHVGHAIALADREHRTPERNLLQLERAIVMADAASRAQMERTLGPRAALPTRVIDLDGLVPSILRRAAQLQPDLIVLATGWEWSATGADGDVLSPAVIQQLGTSLLIVSDRLPPAARRIVVALDPAHLDASTIQAAARWRYWLREAMQAEGLDRIPDLDVVFIEEQGDKDRDLGAAVERDSADLIVLPAEVVAGAAEQRPADRLVSYLLRQAAAPVLLLSRSQSSPWSIELLREQDSRRGSHKAVSLIA